MGGGKKGKEVAGIRGGEGGRMKKRGGVGGRGEIGN